VFFGGVACCAAGVYDWQQLLFSVPPGHGAIGVGLDVQPAQTATRAERMMQERVFAGRFRFQDALSGWWRS